MSRFLKSEKPKSLTPTYKVVLDPARLYRPFGLPKNVQHESTRKGMEDSGISLSLKSFSRRDTDCIRQFYVSLSFDTKSTENISSIENSYGV